MTRRYEKWSAAERANLWERWRRGESLSQIGRALERKSAAVRKLLCEHGGIEPDRRKRRATHLSPQQRESISRSVAKNLSMRAMARELGKAPSTVSREIKRNGGREAYRAAEADKRAWATAKRRKSCKLASQPKLRHLVANKLQQDWSPSQISGWLKRSYSASSGMRVSHETIYKTLFIQARGALKKELVEHLRSQRTLRRSRYSSVRGAGRGQIRDAVSIRDRPSEVDDRAVPGHWEGDLLFGSGKTQIATLVERQSRFTMLVKLDGRDAQTVNEALKKQIRRLPAQLRRSLTWDRGLEMAQHADFTVATGVEVFFCDPQSPWQRGTNENTNGLLRQYFPKRQPVDSFSQAQLDAIARKLNGRPRKTLNFSTPTATLNVALTR